MREDLLHNSQNKVIIEPSIHQRFIDWTELWNYRELMYFLSWRDIKVRYKQTMLGVLWAIIQPLVTMVIFSIFFGKLANVPSDGVPYPIFSYTALIPWTLFSYGFLQSSNSLVQNTNLITKVYFPRIIIPISSVMVGLLDFCVSFLVLFALIIYYQLHLYSSLVFLPMFVILALIASLGVGFWFSALNVKFRDARYIVPFLSQVWLFVTPIAYSSSLIAEPWRSWYGINPMAGVVEGFRWAILGIEPSFSLIMVSVGSAIIIILIGAYYFQRMEQYFADII